MAVGIAAGGADIFAGRGAEPVDRDADRLAELDHQDAAGHADLQLDLACGADDDAAVAAGRGDGGFTANALRLGHRRLRRQHHRQQNSRDKQNIGTPGTRHHAHADKTPDSGVRTESLIDAGG